MDNWEILFETDGEKIKQLYETTDYNLTSLAKLYKVNIQIIRKIIVKLGLSIKKINHQANLPTQKLVKEKIHIIADLHINKRKTIQEISKIFNLQPNTITKALRDFGYFVRKYKYDIDETYFEKINTPEKAYWLGWMYSDGHVDKNQKDFKLKVTRADIEIIHLFKKHLNFTGPIVYGKQRKRSKVSVQISVCRPKMVKDLINLGCVPQKSLILEFPTKEQVPEHLMSHFLRGYFDGDGCVSTKKKHGATAISFCVSKNFGEKLKIIIQSLFNIKANLRKPSKIYTLNFGGRRQCVKFLNWLYNDSENLRLTRKHEKYLLAKNYTKKPSNSGFRGVYWKQSKGIYESYISFTVPERKRVYIGRFTNPIAGAIAYNNYIIKNQLDRELNIIPDS